MVYFLQLIVKYQVYFFPHSYTHSINTVYFLNNLRSITSEFCTILLPTSSLNGGYGGYMLNFHHLIDIKIIFKV